MVLYSRLGYELSDIEKALLFEKKDAGYVVWSSRRKGIAQLSPSPFLKPKDTFYVFETEAESGTMKTLPEENELIEVEVASTYRIPLSKPVNGRNYLIKKVVKSWRRINPSSLIKKYSLEEYLRALGLDPTPEDIKKLREAGLRDEVYRSVFDPDIIRSVVMHPFKRIDNVAIDTILMFLASSPPSSLKGGISAAAFGSKSAWRALERLFRAIPPEFRRINRKVFYRYAENPGTFSPDNVSAKEVSLDHYNPEDLHVHLPQPLQDVKVNERMRVKELELPLLRAFMIQALLITPHIREDAENELVNRVYMVHEATILSGEDLPFNLDMSFVKRVPLSMGRVVMKDEISRKDIQETIDNWIHAYREALKDSVRPISPKIYFQMGEGERFVYNTIVELGGLEHPVSYREIYNEVHRKISGYDLENILKILNMRGAIIETRVNHYLAIELR